MNHQEFARYPSLTGKTVFLTGGASGIGADIVQAIADQGAKVGFVDLNADAGQAMLDKIGADHAFECCDLRDIDALRAAFSALALKLGDASVLVNNAARGTLRITAAAGTELAGAYSAGNVNFQGY